MSLVVEVVRSGFVESRHQARMLTLDATGTPVAVHGAVHVPASPRSSMKPLQALGMLRAGLAPGAVSCSRWPAPATRGSRITWRASEDPRGGRAGGVRRCRLPGGLPRGRGRSTDRGRVYMNCSGKHAAMLATCVRQRLAAGDVPGAGASAAAGDPRHGGGADRRAGRRLRGGRVRRAAVLRLDAGRGPSIRHPRAGPGEQHQPRRQPGERHQARRQPRRAARKRARRAVLKGARKGAWGRGVFSMRCGRIRSGRPALTGLRRR